MKKIAFKFFFLLCFFLISNNVSAEILKKIEISGNKRISNETIKVYGDIQINKNYQEDEINDVIKKLFKKGGQKYAQEKRSDVTKDEFLNMFGINPNGREIQDWSA